MSPNTRILFKRPDLWFASLTIIVLLIRWMYHGEHIAFLSDGTYFLIMTRDLIDPMLYINLITALVYWMFLGSRDFRFFWTIAHVASACIGTFAVIYTIASLYQSTTLLDPQYILDKTAPNFDVTSVDIAKQSIWFQINTFSGIIGGIIFLVNLLTTKRKSR
ncbi:MAG: hypothetical protein AAFX87_07210 [Bacteroidota bacterium]